MFERFTPTARQAVMEARAQARELGHHWVGCEHLLLALAGSSDPTGELLRARGVTPERVTSTIGELTDPHAGSAAGSAQGPMPAGDAEALALLGIDLDKVRQAVEATFGAGALDRPWTVAPARSGSARWAPARWAATLLRRLRFRLRVRRRRRTCWETSPRSGHLPFTPRAKRCLERSLREAIRLRHRHIGAEHLALALTAFDDTMAAAVLARLGVGTARLRADLTESLRRSA